MDDRPPHGIDYGSRRGTEALRRSVPRDPEHKAQ
jgi:hypothetical protein